MTLRAFVEKAQTSPYNCELKVTTVQVSGPRGPVQWRYLKRGDLIGVLPDIEDYETLPPANHRSLIAELNLPALEFGLEFG